MTSPHYENAFRFEAAYRKGFYLTFLPPNHLRVAPHDDDRCLVDFTLVDFSMMFKFIEMEEVLQPAVAAYEGQEVTLSELRKDPNIVLYFKNILHKQIWADEDFIIYFEGHWETWEFNKETQAVRPFKSTLEMALKGLKPLKTFLKPLKTTRFTAFGGSARSLRSWHSSWRT